VPDVDVSADPLREARRRLEQDGYVVLRQAVPADAVGVVVRRLNMAIRHHGLTADEIAEWQTTGFFPHLRSEPEVWAVLPPVAPDLLGWEDGDQWGEPQLLLQFPDEAQERVVEPHVDALPPWAADRSYRGVVGVALTTAGPEDGVGCVWPGSHRGEPGELTPVPLDAGDAVVMHPDLSRTGSLNLGQTVRMAIYFRLIAGAVA
jgi:ectoine hydroxylase-related dioxygenase (phytanoyl-CoA dioxygenase family)